MESYEALVATIALTCGASWASGINLYAVILVLGLGSNTGDIVLPEDLQVLSSPVVLLAAGLMYCVEFFADKIPGLDTAWDTLHTFVRIPAGAMLAAGAVGDISPALEIAAGLMGGSLAATSHAAKTGTRMLINTSPEPFSNWGASVSEDVIVLGGLWAALNHPILFLAALVVILLITAWILPKLWRLIKKVLRKIRSFFSSDSKETNLQDTDKPMHTSVISTVEELERLQKLKLAGALTEQEFEQQKRKLLGTNELDAPG